MIHHGSTIPHLPQTIVPFHLSCFVKYSIPNMFHIEIMIISVPMAGFVFAPTNFSFPHSESLVRLVIPFSNCGLVVSGAHKGGIMIEDFSELALLSTFKLETCCLVSHCVDSAGFAFVYMEDERDADDAIRRLDRIEFGRKGRRLRVEWTKQERGIRRPGGSPKKSSSNSRPSKTLFVINFDPIHTRTRDLERHFEPHGRISNVRIRRNFAFVQFELQEDATRALEALHMSKFMDRAISVEYAIRDDDDRRNGYSPDRRGRDMSPDRRGHGRGRSPSPYRRDRGSPDYGHGSIPSSRAEPRGSPDYGRAESPVNERYHSRSPPPRERSRS